MHIHTGITRTFLAALGAACVVLAGCAGMSGPETRVMLSGMSEVPAVNSTASGDASIWVNRDKTLSGSVRTRGIDARGAYIYVGLSGTNGPIAVRLTQSGDGSWSVPAGAKFTHGQYEAFLGGETYVSVLSAAYPDGEIRGQLRP
jgi:hypothetical protein